MANPVIRSVSSTSTDTDGASVIITKPSGMLEDDLLIAYVSMFNVGADRTITTLAGWTLLAASNESDRRNLSCYYKIASAADEAASDFTWSFSGTVDKSGGAMYAITGYAAGSEITISETDIITPASDTVTATTALTPAVSESLIITAYMPTDTDLAATLTASSFSLTPTTTLTEDVDTGVRDGASDGFSLMIASADYDGTTEITSRSVTVSESITGSTPTIALLVNAPEDASGTVALHAVSPSFYAPVAEVGATGTNALHSVSPTIPTQSGNSTSPTQWTNEAEESTTWTNETL